MSAEASRLARKLATSELDKSEVEKLMEFLSTMSLTKNEMEQAKLTVNIFSYQGVDIELLRQIIVKREPNVQVLKDDLIRMAGVFSQRGNAIDKMIKSMTPEGAQIVKELKVKYTLVKNAKVKTDISLSRVTMAFPNICTQMFNMIPDTHPVMTRHVAGMPKCFLSPQLPAVTPTKPDGNYTVATRKLLLRVAMVNSKSLDEAINTGTPTEPAKMMTFVINAHKSRALKEAARMEFMKGSRMLNRDGSLDPEVKDALVKYAEEAEFDYERVATFTA